ncbi:MAG: tetratricopeptide repeat protein [Acidobacteriota bacterium]
MSYPGNASLGTEIRERLLRTFSQTLDLAAQGSVQEALLGCDFILRMDPLFEPARTLHQRLTGAPGGVAVDDLRALVFQGSTAPAAPAAPAATVAIPQITRPGAPGAGETSFADLGLGKPEVAPPPTAPPPDTRALRAEMERAAGARDFKAVLALADRERRAVATDPALQQIAEAARARSEAQPYVERFLDAARQAVQAGQTEEVSRLLDKVASLDPTHPGIGEIQEMQRQYSDPSRTMGGRRRGIAMDEEEAAPLELAAPSVDPTGGKTYELHELTLEDETPGPSGLSLVEPEPAPPALEPPPPPPPAAAPSLDLSLAMPAVAPTASDSDPRIAELLDEGQAAYDRGEYQSAIDAWSRVFLIDIDHGEAAKRIEMARRLKAEAERKVEEIFQEGVALLANAQAEEARQCFERVLDMQPNHLAAREYLQQIEAGKVKVQPRPTAPVKAGAAVARTAEKAEAKAPEPLKEEILVPPEPGEQRPRPSREMAPPLVAAKRSSAGRRFALLGAIVLVIAAAGGYFVWQNKERLFPNSRPPAAAVTPAPDAISRATALHGQGKGAIAIAQLRRLPPEDPLYPKAQALIAQWEAEEQKTKPAPELGPDDAAKRDQLIEAARQAYGERRYLRASALFDQAAAVRALDGPAADLAADAKRQIQPLEKYLKLYKDGEWEFALRELWREHEKDPGNRDVTKLMVDSYYNLGVRDLQRDAAQDGLDKFKEALALDPQDRDLQRLALFVEAYKSHGQDLLYRTFVKYLAFRA